MFKKFNYIVSLCIFFFKATPFPNSFKCFTCENAGDNYNCNRWAEDKWCPQSKCAEFGTLFVTRPHLDLSQLALSKGILCDEISKPEGW